MTATAKSEADKNTYSMFNLQTGLLTDACELDETVAGSFLVPSANVRVSTKFIRDGIRYESLSEEEKTQRYEKEWNGENEVPDGNGSKSVGQRQARQNYYVCREPAVCRDDR